MQQPLQHSQCSWPSHSPSSASCSVSSVDSPTHPRATSWAVICHCSFISSAACTVKQVQIFSITTDQISLVNFCQLPCIMWLIIYKPRRFSLSWLTNWVRITRMQCNWVPRVSSASSERVGLTSTSFPLCSTCSSDMHCHWGAADGAVTDWRTSADDSENQDIQILPRLLWSKP